MSTGLGPTLRSIEKNSPNWVVVVKVSLLAKAWINEMPPLRT